MEGEAKEVLVLRTVTLVLKRCSVCGVEMWAHRASKKYCSGTCGNRAYKGIPPEKFRK